MTQHQGKKEELEREQEVGFDWYPLLYNREPLRGCSSPLFSPPPSILLSSNPPLPLFQLPFAVSPAIKGHLDFCRARFLKKNPETLTDLLPGSRVCRSARCYFFGNDNYNPRITFFLD